MPTSAAGSRRPQGHPSEGWRSCQGSNGEAVGRQRRYLIAKATALITRRDPGFRRDDDSGFTLVEMMVVVAIIGVMSAAVVMNLPDPRGDLLQEAERLAARAGAARDAAIVEAKPTALVLGPAGYGFSRRERGAWVPITEKPLGQRAWGEGVTALTGPAGEARVVFDSTGLADPATVTLVRDGMRVSVAIGPDGGIDVQ